MEDDDYSGLFTTQESRSDCQKDVDTKESLMEVGDDEVFSNNLSVNEEVNVPETDTKQGIYSDISDPEDDFVNPIYGRTYRYVC